MTLEDLFGDELCPGCDRPYRDHLGAGCPVEKTKTEHDPAKWRPVDWKPAFVQFDRPAKKKAAEKPKLKERMR